MKKIVITLLFTIATLFQLHAQQLATVTASVVDSATSETIPGAVFKFTPNGGSDGEKFASADANGKLEVGGLPYGTYTMTVSFIGYDNYVRQIEIRQKRVSLGTIRMVEGSTQIDAVKIEVQSMRTSQKGDTVSYNASAFKVSNDSDVEGLLKKMPGITIKDGEVEAQGETIKKIFVDGKEFFGEDVTTAIKSLPAQAVKSVEVYNKLSDQAEFSGMDDGEGYKAINIVTHSNMRQGQFGKMYAGYGYDADTDDHHKYLVGGNVNIFNNDSRLSIIGLFNNVNQQNFSFEDIVGVSGNTGGGGRPRGVGQYMVRPQSGIASVNSLGLNYSDTWGKEDNVTFQGSYFFNHTSTVNHSTLDKWYEDPYEVDTLSTVGNSKTINYNNRLNARIEWKISPNQSIMSRTGVSFQSNTPFSRTFGRQWGESGYSIIDNYSKGNRNGYNIREFLQYRAKLGKDGRTITVDGNFNYRSNDNSTNSYSNSAIAAEYDYLVPADTIGLHPYELLYQRTVAPKREYVLRGNFTYTEPLSKNAQLSFQYRAEYENQQSDKRAFTGLDGFASVSGEPNPLLSNTYASEYVKHRVGPGFRYSKERNTLVANVYYQRSSLDGQVKNAQQENIKDNYNNVTYFLMGNLIINKQNTLRLFVRSGTDTPEVTDLQGIYDVSNAQYITRGNPNLNPTYSHFVSFHYVNSNINKGRTFMWMFMMNNTSDYVTSHTILNPELEINGEQYRPLQYSQKINMDGYWSLRTHLSYGLPLSFMKCNLNLSTGVNYTIVPTKFGGEFNAASGQIVGGERNNASTFAYDARVMIGSNISENIDFSVGWNGSYSLAKNSLASRPGNNRYFYHQATASVKATFLKGFTFMGSFSYTQNIGFTNNYNDDYILCNLYLGHKLFKNKRGEIQVGVNDLFNQNKAFVRSVGSGYTQNATNSVVGRYYTIQFVYNLRHFGKKGSKNLSDYGIHEGNGRTGMRPPGAPMR